MKRTTKFGHLEECVVSSDHYSCDIVKTRNLVFTIKLKSYNIVVQIASDSDSDTMEESPPKMARISPASGSDGPKAKGATYNKFAEKMMVCV